MASSLIIVFFCLLVQVRRGKLDDFISLQKYEKILVPILSSNYLVVSLGSVVEKLFQYETVTSHQLSTFQFTNGTYTLPISIGSQSTFMLCSIPPQNGPRGYFCLDQSNWSIKTTSKYSPSTNVEESITLTLKTTGVKNENSTTGYYEVLIRMLPRCLAQKEVYNKLSPCKPVLKSLSGTSSSVNGEKYTFPSEEANKVLKLQYIKFDMFSQIGALSLHIFDDNQMKLYNQPLTVTGTSYKLATALRLYSKTTALTLKFYDGTKYISAPNRSVVTLNYYIMNDFCGNGACDERYYYWDWIVKYIPPVENKCVKDEHGLREAFNSCYSSLAVSVTGNQRKYKLTDPLQLKCTFGDILLSHTIEWYRLRGTKIVQLASSDVFYNVSRLSYYDYAHYQCKVLTQSKRYTSMSTKYGVILSDVFTGELQFQLDDIRYSPFYSNSESPLYKLRKQQLERYVQDELNTADSSKPTEPKFEINSLSNNLGKVWVKGDLSMRKSRNAAKAMSYLEWFHFVTNRLRRPSREFSTSQISNQKLFTQNTCRNSSVNVSHAQYVYKFSATELGKTVALNCPGSNTLFAYRQCKRFNNYDYAYWTQLDDSRCLYGTATAQLKLIATMNVTKDNALTASKQLQEISSNISSISTPYDVGLLTSSVEKFLEFLNSSKDVENNIMTSVDNVLEIDKSILTNSEVQDSSTTRILNFLGNAGDKLASTIPRSISKKNFALGGIKMTRNNFKGLSVDVKHKKSTNQVLFRKGKSVVPINDAESIIKLPDNLVDSLPKDLVEFNIVALFYQNDKLFVKDTTNMTGEYSDKDWLVNSHVMSAEVRGQSIRNLNKPVILHFKSVNSSILDHDKACVYWDVTQRIWTSEGCYLYSFERDSGAATCHCNHLTNFAILFNATLPSGIHAKILTIVTNTGLGISLVGALLTFLTYVIFPMLRDTIPPRILMNLCAALILMTILFTAGVEKRTSEVGCQAIAIVLQYCFLSVFSWSAVEGFHSTRGMVFPMKVEINMFIQKAMVFGWGVPIIFTAIGAGVWSDDYGEKESCVVKSTPVYVTFLASVVAVLLLNMVALTAIINCVVTGKPFIITLLVPMAFAISFNLISLAAILVSLHGSSKKYTTHALKSRDRFRIIVAFIVLFGITWVFGFLVISNDILAFQYLFCILCSLQGLYIFLFYCVRNKKVRKFWMMLFRGTNVKEIGRSTTRRLQKQRAGTGETLAFNSVNESKEWTKTKE